MLASGVLLLLAGCRPAPPPTTTPPPTPQSPPTPKLEFQWLTPTESSAAEGLLAAPGSQPARKAFLAAYRQTWQDLRQAEGSGIVPVLLRLWEWNRAVRVAHLSAAQVRAALGLTTTKAPPSYHPKATMDQRQEGWRLATPETFDADVRGLLKASRDDGGAPYTGVARQWLRYIVVVDRPDLLDPNLPLHCEGTVEPVSGTAFLTENDAITGQRRAAWRIAAALIHEAGHVQWYYEKAGQDPRLLDPVPDERNAYLGMFEFGRAVMQSGGAGTDHEGLAQQMEQWRGIVRQANGLLGYPADDLSVRSDLNVSDEVLEEDPVTCAAEETKAKQ